MAKDPAERPVDAHRVQALLEIIAQALGVPVPVEPSKEAPPSMVPRSVGDPWKRRVELFEHMLARAHPASTGGPPGDLVRALDRIRALLGEVEALRESALEEQQRLEAIEHADREGRLRLGGAMDALTNDAHEVREEARALRARAASLGEASRGFSPRMMAAHKELVLWEGRSGFREPHRELAAAYRGLADLVDRWVDARRSEIEAEAEAAQKERGIADVDFQIRSLRESLSQHDRSFDERRRVSQERIAEMGNRTQAIEDEMLRLASYFCAPLRPLPVLAPLFYELEQAAPVALARMGPSAA